MSPLEWLRGRVALLKVMKGDEEKASTPAAGARTAPGIDPSADLEHLRAGMQAIRDNLKGYAAALGALATVVFAGVSLATIDTLFPLPDRATWLWIPAVALALLGVGGVGWLTSAFFAAQRRIVFKPSSLSPSKGQPTPRSKEQRGLRRGEQRAVGAVLDEHASEEGAASALSLELRALRLARVARRLEGETSKLGQEAAALAQKESDRLNGALTTAVLRAALSIIEARAARVFGWVTKAALAVTAVGVIGLVAVSQYAQGERELVALGESCAKAEVAGVTGSCEKIGVAYTAPPTPAAPTTPTTQESVQRVRTCATEVDTALVGAPPVPAALRDQLIAACVDVAAAVTTEEADDGAAAEETDDEDDG
jgi:hypothetical protein